MNSSMTIPTYWNDIKPKLWFIAVPMMILGGLISAFNTRERRCSRHQTLANLIVNSVLGATFLRMVESIVSVAFIQRCFASSCFAVFFLVGFFLDFVFFSVFFLICPCLCRLLIFSLSLFSLWFLIASTAIDIMKQSTSRRLTIRFDRLFKTQLAPTVMTIQSRFTFVKIRQQFSIFTLGTGFCYNGFRHCNFLNKLSCLGPVASTTLAIGSLYIKG